MRKFCQYQIFLFFKFDRSAALGHAVDLAADHGQPLADRHPTQDPAGEEDALAAYPDDDG